MTNLENLPGVWCVVHTLVTVLVNNKASHVVSRVREDPSLEPVSHVIDVVEEDLVLPVDSPPSGVRTEPPVGPGQLRPGLADLAG